MIPSMLLSMRSCENRFSSSSPRAANDHEGCQHQPDGGGQGEAAEDNEGGIPLMPDIGLGDRIDDIQRKLVEFAEASAAYDTIDRRRRGREESAIAGRDRLYGAAVETLRRFARSERHGRVARQDAPVRCDEGHGVAWLDDVLPPVRQARRRDDKDGGAAKRAVRRGKACRHLDHGLARDPALVRLVDGE